MEWKRCLENVLVLNLVISGIPSILGGIAQEVVQGLVLNLVISGIPSIQMYG